MDKLKKGRYKHIKGAEYYVHGIATHSESGESLVVYEALDNAGELWVRPYEMFTEMIQTPNGLRPRFTFIAAE